MNTMELADGQGLISPDHFPVTSAQVRKAAAWMREQAERARKLEHEVEDTTQQLVKRWGYLSSWYEAPESAQLLGAMGPVGDAARLEVEKIQAGRKMQDRFADELDALARRVANVEDSAWALRKPALEGFYADQADVDTGRVVTYGRHAGLLPPDILHGVVLTGAVWIDWRCWRSSAEGNNIQLIEAAKVFSALRQAQEDFARDLQKLQNDGSGRSGVPRWPGGSSAWGDVPPPPWFGTATPQQVRDWWNTLSAAEKAAAADAIAAMNLDDAVVEDLVVGSLRGVADSDADADVQALNAVLGAFGQDEDAMAGALSAAGGATVVGALDALGRNMSRTPPTTLTVANTAAATARNLREQVARASDRWSTTQARTFGRDVATRTMDHPTPVAYLFADPEHAPMSETITVTVANGLDAWERSASGGEFYDAAGPPEGMGLHEVSTVPLTDPMARVLQTMGRYPDAALDWLTSSSTDPVGGESTLGKARVVYYYGQRNSSGAGGGGSGDGFEGVAALWAGAQQAEGSLIDPLHEDDEVQQRVANLSTSIFEHLAGHERLTSEGMTPGGAEQLSTAVMQQLPQLAVNGINGLPDGTANREAPLFEVDNENHRDQRVPVVNAAKEDIAAVVGPALTRPEGMEVAQDASADYTARVVESLKADKDVLASGEAQIQAGRALQVDAALEGARIGALLDTAQRSESAARELVDFGVGYVAGKVDVPLGYAGGKAKGHGAGLLTELVTGWITDHGMDKALQAEVERAAEVDRLTEQKADTLGEVLADHHDQGSLETFNTFWGGVAETAYKGWEGTPE